MNVGKPLLITLLILLTFAPAGAAFGTQSPATPVKKQIKEKKEANRASAYYHYSLAHMYEELVAIYGRSEFATKAIEEYRLAMENDPESDFLAAGLAELYAKTGRIRDAVLEAQEIIQRDPNNIDARRLLGRIYLRTLGDMQSGTQSQEVLKRALEQFQEISRLEPDDIENWLLLGRLYRLDNQLVKAEESFRKAVSLAPDSEEAVTSLAILFTEEGDTARAIEVLDAVPEEARTAKIYSVLGLAYEQQNEYRKAIAAYQRALELDRENLDSMRGLAQNLMNDGQDKAALERYKAIAEADPRDPQAQLRMAELYRRDGEFDEALKHLSEAEKLVPDSLEIPYHKALIYESQGRWEEAIAALEDLLERTARPVATYNTGERNNRAVFLERLGTIYRDLQQTEKAVNAFRQVLDLGNENAPRGYHQIIETYRSARQWTQARATAEEAVKKFPNDKSLQLVLAGQMADDGQEQTALELAESLAKQAPDDRAVYVGLAQLNSRLRRWPQAEEAIAKALELSQTPEEKQYARFMQASVLERQKQYAEAEEIFRSLLAQDPDNDMVLNYLGYMLADNGEKLDDALAMVQEAVRRDPQNGAYLDSLGWVYYRLGNYPKAEEYLRRATARIPNDPTVHDHLGDLYLKTGRLRLATVHFERALAEWKASPAAEVEDEEVAATRRKLESAKVELARQNARSQE